MKLAVIYARCVGLLLLGLGLWTLIAPVVFTERYGVALPTAEAEATIRAVIGGGECAIAALFLWPGRFAIPAQGLSLFGAVLFTGLVLGRLTQLLVGPAFGERMMIETAIETMLALAFWLSWLRSAPTPRDRDS